MQDFPQDPSHSSNTYWPNGQGTPTGPAGQARDEAPSSSKTIPAPGDLARIFNTALIATRVETQRDFATELFRLVETPAFSAILEAIRILAASQNLSEKAAAEAVIRAFREADRIWGDYLQQEGVDRLKAHFPQS
jgi:hypothetical protein